MSDFSFRSTARRLPRWLGPYSPARGTTYGFRFHRRRLGTWVADQFGREFWPLADSAGARALARLVRYRWGGGRVLLLPNGLAIKPLPGDDDVGVRVLIGTFKGRVLLERPGGQVFDMGSTRALSPGCLWPGPRTTGIECILRGDGSLMCVWHHPSESGRITKREVVHGPDRALASGFRHSRPGKSHGRVRVTANGLVITNRLEPDRVWRARYVGRILPETWPHRPEWIEKERK